MKTFHGCASRPSNGFTLVELLSVIAVIAILSMILIPVVGTIRQKMHWMEGSANIRQVTLGLLMIAAENDGNLIRADALKPNGNKGNWGMLLTQYLNGGDLNLNPRETLPILRDPLVRVTAKSVPLYHYAPLAIVAWHGDAALPPQWEGVQNLAGHHQPSRQIYLADAVANQEGAGVHANLWLVDGGHWGWGSRHASGSVNTPIAPGTNQMGDIRWTDGKAKFGFMDGHTAILSQEEVKRVNVNPLLQ